MGVVGKAQDGGHLSKNNSFTKINKGPKKSI